MKMFTRSANYSRRIVETSRQLNRRAQEGVRVRSGASPAEMSGKCNQSLNFSDKCTLAVLTAW